jgi:hypothetical protein
VNLGHATRLFVPYRFMAKPAGTPSEASGFI